MRKINLSLENILRVSSKDYCVCKQTSWIYFVIILQSNLISILFYNLASANRKQDFTMDKYLFYFDYHKINT